MKNEWIVNALTQLFSARTSDQRLGKRALNRNFLRSYPSVRGERRDEFYMLVSRERATLTAILNTSSADRDMCALEALHPICAEALASTTQSWDQRLEPDAVLEPIGEIALNVRRVMLKCAAGAKRQNE